jgi:error-prone DNA polymerase
VVNGLRQEHGEQIERDRNDRQFKSLEDFKRRVEISKEELRALAELGALNCFAKHRRVAMWKVEEPLHDDLLDRGTLGSTCASHVVSGAPAGNLPPFGEAPNGAREGACAPQNEKSPLAPMTVQERVTADYRTMNLTAGPHPMKLLRDRLPNIWRASDLPKAKHGSTIQIAGNVICRQRPGTAKGFVFVSLEDETGVSNAIVDPDLFERYRLLITEEDFLVIEGEVQNSENTVLIKTREIKPLAYLPAIATALQAGDKLVGSESHDFR